jgi:GDP-4-dehydro-6-deoxy-D-mannose reductase
MIRRFKRILITGISGAGGSCLAEHIVAHQPDVAVHGFIRPKTSDAQDHLAGIRDRITLHKGELMDPDSFSDALARIQPEVIFHFASQANVKAAFSSPSAVLSNNIMGTINVLEAARHFASPPLLVLSGSSEVYGQMDPAHIPTNENCPLRPTNPYAVSKATQDMLGESYFLNYGLKIIRTRVFSYINPRRADLFASAFARQVARIEAGLQKELLHGNLQSVRTLVDARDVAEAFWMAAERCEPGQAYNIGGPTVLTIGDFLNKLISLSRVPVKTRLDPALLRPTDDTRHVADVTKFTAATGWKPRHAFEKSLEFLLTYWRERTNAELLSGKASS